MVKNEMLANNIKILRNSFDETQLELALAIGLDSPNTISNYEKGLRTPAVEIKRKIAQHYRVTEEWLCYHDLSDFLDLKTFFSKDLKDLNLEIVKKWFLVTFPVVISSESKNSEEFMKAYKSHMILIDFLFDRNEDTNIDNIVDTIFESYDNAIEEKCYEAKANLLSLIFLIEYCDNMENVFNYNLPLGKCFKFKNVYLRENLDSDCSTMNINKIDQDLDGEIIELMQDLIGIPRFKDLVYYFMALRYVCGCENNGNSIEMNSLIGANIMLSLVKFNNKYACKYLKNNYSLFKK